MIEMGPLDVATATGAGEVVTGLRATPRRLPSWLHYDRLGSRLFDAICELDEYYVTRIERSILEERAGEIAACVGSRAVLIEPGAGAATKTELLLSHLDDPAQWVPIDVARDHLADSTARIRRRFPALAVAPVIADYGGPIAIPDPPADVGARVVFFPGSTIGNLDASESVRFLLRMSALADFVIVGADLEKAPAIMEAAYDDPQGVTAAFSKNLLAHVNAIEGADFDVRSWRHRARWNPVAHRMEAHLIAERPMRVHVGADAFTFEAGDEIWVESSYKYTPERFALLASLAGLSVQRLWTDTRGWFGVFLLVRS